MVITTVRCEEQKRFEDAGDGDKEVAKFLKNSRYILLSNPEILARKDQISNEAKPGRRESAVFSNSFRKPKRRQSDVA